MEKHIKRLTNIGIPIAKHFRTLGYNVRANIDKDDQSLLFEMRDFHKQLRFSSRTESDAITWCINTYIARETTPHIEEIARKRQIYRSNNNQEIIKCKHSATTSGYTLI